MMSRRYSSARNAILVMLAISVMAGCTGPGQTRHATPQEVGGASSRGVPDETRGIYVDFARLGFDHTRQVRHRKTGISHELHDGDTAVTGDRIHASIQTSENAYLYLAFCAHQELTLYPSQGGIQTRAGEIMSAPKPGAELILDDDPGPEVLYVILSRTEISVADPHLASALAARRPRNMPVDCGASLDAELAKPPRNAGSAKAPTPHSTNVLRGESVRKKSIPSTRAANDQQPPPDPDFERNPGNIVWYGRDGATGPADVIAADDDGIAVVRHAFLHVPLASPP